MSPPTPLRAPGLMESYHLARHFLKIDSCLLVSARYICADGSILNKEQLFPALEKVIQKHPILAVMLQDEGTNKPSFVKLEKIELPLVVEFSNETDLESAMQRQLANRLDTTARLPLWRVEVFNDGTVIFAFHHCIGDALSGVIFHQTLLAALQDVVPADITLSVAIPQSLSLLPPIEAVINLRPSLLTIISEVFSLFIPASWKPGYKAWTANPVPKEVPKVYQPHVKIITFTTEEMAAFMTICRSHGATVTSAFYVLAAAVLSRLVPPNSSQYKTLAAVVAVSLRDWPAAARYAVELQRQKTEAAKKIGLIYLLFGNIAPFFKGMLGKKRDETFEISNVGRVPSAAATDAAERWRIERIVFAQSNLVTNAALKINVIGDPTGAVNVALTWGKTSIDGELVELFARQFQEGFRILLV
ncbi:hypothetical protein MVEN_00969500 [Mycena venus]|uniref:Alcohol acetyltransferase n=1 Tax=Mycena venus TaxID=2733690 RepID=A0A8H6YCT2_9AGAR|nr:hypothetical protein MVEN_00969500 [Mycena venus]